MSSVADQETTKNLAPWSERWKDNRIGFHLIDINEALRAHGDELLTAVETSPAGQTNANDGSKVLVPLCGKSVDMAYFAKHPGVTEVVGVEGIKKALQEFAIEHPDLGVKQIGLTGSGTFEAFRGNNITLFRGDFFELTRNDIGGKVSAVFDRGSLVAIEPNMREEYLHVMKRVVAPGGKILLVAVEHDDGKGPPFSITESDVRRLYDIQEWVASVRPLNPQNEQADGLGRLDRWYMIQVK